ncbi:MAG: Ni/Co efflux regulator RcnB [Gammaproteobacteria bacterium]|jgi:Ni/Co efflux regulator RcnB
MRNKIYAILISIPLLISASAFALADVAGDIVKKAADAAFSEAERQAIKKYYEVTRPVRDEERHIDRDDHDDDEKSDYKERKGEKKHKGKDKGKGKGKNKELPKGIAKKLERGGTLPPGIAKRGLPSNLEEQLPPPPEGYERVISDGKVVLTDIATGVIADIINIAKKRKTDVTKDKVIEENKTSTVSTTQEKNQTPEKSEKKWWQIWKD